MACIKDITVAHNKINNHLCLDKKELTYTQKYLCSKYAGTSSLRKTSRFRD